MSTKILYVAHYGDDNKENGRISSPAGQTKMNYIIDSLIDLGKSVEVVSMIAALKSDKLIQFNPGYKKKINGIDVVFFSSFSSKYKIIRLVSKLLFKLSVLFYLLRNDSHLYMFYHSLDSLGIVSILRFLNKSYILEVEEIYSDVLTGIYAHLKPVELALVRHADSYIFSTEMLAPIITSSNNYIVCYGPYRPEKVLSEKYTDGNIHCVYAGTFDPTKGGAAAAVSAAEYLPSNYHIHILGFGSESDTKLLLSQIEAINKISECEVTYDGLLSGREYLRFLQKCHIGLCTQTPNLTYVNTSFPSKILVYLANGLQVLSVSIPAVVNSSIGKLLYIYDEQSPENIAKGIMRIDMNNNADGRIILNDLDYNFKNDFNLLIEKLLK